LRLTTLLLTPEKRYDKKRLIFQKNNRLQIFLNFTRYEELRRRKDAPTLRKGLSLSLRQSRVRLPRNLGFVRESLRLFLDILVKYTDIHRFYLDIHEGMLLGLADSGGGSQTFVGG